MTCLFHIDPASVADAGDELSIQVALRKALKLTTGVRFVAIPNGAQRTAWSAMKAKQEGLASGFPDAIVLGPERLIAFLEIKARTGSLSEQQHIWLNYLTAAGFNCGVYRSVATALDALRDWGFPVGRVAA